MVLAQPTQMEPPRIAAPFISKPCRNDGRVSTKWLCYSSTQWTLRATHIPTIGNGSSSGLAFGHARVHSLDLDESALAHDCSRRPADRCVQPSGTGAVRAKERFRQVARHLVSRHGDARRKNLGRRQGEADDNRL